MRATGRDFADVLKEAQDLGYAEADPSFDIDGVDAHSHHTRHCTCRHRARRVTGHALGDLIGQAFHGLSGRVGVGHSTVTVLARLRGRSTSRPWSRASE